MRCLNSMMCQWLCCPLCIVCNRIWNSQNKNWWSVEYKRGSSGKCLCMYNQYKNKVGGSDQILGTHHKQRKGLRIGIQCICFCFTDIGGSAFSVHNRYMNAVDWSDKNPGYPHLCKGMHENKNKGKKGCTCLFLDTSCQCVSVMARGLSTLIVIISVFALFHRSLDVLSIQYRTIYFRVILLYLFFTLAQTVSGRNLKHDLCKSYASF